MKDSRELGSSSLLLVLLLFALGMLMLDGLAQQLTSWRKQVFSEIGLINEYVQAQSALAWSGRQNWRQQSGWQCQIASAQAWRACIYPMEKGQVLIAASGVSTRDIPPLTLWRWGTLQGSRMVMERHGWLDFCPLMDDELCSLPR